MAKTQHPSRLERILVPALLVALIGASINLYYELADHKIRVIGQLADVKVEIARLDERMRISGDASEDLRRQIERLKQLCFGDAETTD